jgi:hypothetical protein
MAFSQGTSKSKSMNNARAVSGPPARHKILYRVAFPAYLLTLLSWTPLWPVAAIAQEERPQITPGERKAPRKKDAEPRAVALLQLTSNGKASLLPIAILINGKFWDASAYKATPVPMALESGTIYEAERSGSSQGLFTVSSALRSNAPNAQSPWIGTGSWVPAGAEKPKASLQAEAAPVGLDTSEGPPRLTKNPSKETPAASTPPASAPAPAPPSQPRSGDEPPRLTKPANQAPPVSTAPPSTPSSAPPQGDSKGTPGAPQSESKPGDAKPADKPRAPESDSGADSGSRPRLRRGKPAESFADEEIPGYSKPGATPSENTGKASEAAPAGPVQLIPAISDSGGPDPHSYGFEFLKDEEGERLQQMTAMAKQQVRTYLDAQAKARITPKPTAQASHLRSAKKGPEPILSNVQMKAYDLWSSNQPVLIFSAQAQMPPAAPGASTGSSDDLQYSIILVAYPDIYHDLHKIYAGVTDKYHLDLTPRLELIDAIDADGDGRGELLFRETSDGGSGWVIYRASADKLWKIYDSLNPE